MPSQSHSQPHSKAHSALAASVLLLAAISAPAAMAQAPFTAAPAVFPAAGSNTHLVQTIAVHVVTPSAIGSITIPVGFVANPDFVVLGQTGCVVDGSTINAAGTTCSVSVSFRPVGPGLRSATLAVADGAGRVTAFGISGTGYYSQVAITPAAARIAAGLGPTSPGFSGDGGIATLAALDAPIGIAADAFGNVFFADTGNNVVRMLDAFGNITTIAGGGTTAGAAADGAPATSASLSQPTWLAVDSAGNLFITEAGNNVIRRVAISSTRTISTVAGSYAAGSSDGTSAITATLNNPTGIVLDPQGNLYIADSGNQRIRRVDALTGLIATVAGTGATGFDAATVKSSDARFNTPLGLAIDLAGNLYIADSVNHVVRMLSGGSVSVVAGTGTPGHTGDTGLATAATLTTPSGLAVDAAGDLLLSDSASGIVRRIEATTGIIDTIVGLAKDAGSYTPGVAPSTSTRMFAPNGIALDAAQRLFLADTGNNLIRLISGAPGELTFAAQSVGNTSAPLTATIANIGNAPLTFTSVAPVSTTATNFTLNNACTSAVPSGAHCSLNVAFAPQTTGPLAGEIDLVDNAGLNYNFTYTQPIYLAGGLLTSLTIGPSTLPPTTINVPFTAAISASGGYGTITLQSSTALPPGLSANISGTTLTLSGTPTTLGVYTFTVYASDTLGETAVQTYTITVAQPLLTLPINETVFITDNPIETPVLNLNINETIQTSDNALTILRITILESITATDALSNLAGLRLTVPESITTTDALSNLAGLKLTVPESITTTDAVQTSTVKPSQTITLPTLSAHTYGDAPFAVTATATSGLPVTVTVISGPGVLSSGSLDLTGAGTVTLSYTQAGDANNLPAPTLSQAINVAPASATVSAASVTRAFLQPNPALKFTISGLVHGDLVSTLGGTPALSTAAVQNSPAGIYPIVAAQGTLPTTNYVFTFVPGTLTIAGHVAQTITFLPVPNVPLSVSTLTFTAHSTSGLPITYIVNGPAIIQGNKLQLTGLGPVTVTATQPGNPTYDPATPVVRNFTVIP